VNREEQHFIDPGSETAPPRRVWLIPIAVLAGLALAIFAGFWLLDYFYTGGPPVADPGNPVARYVTFDSGFITDATSGLAAMLAAVLGIVITVVSIIVQLSADRYTGVAQMFLRDKINLAVMAYFVIACVCGVWVSMSIHSDFIPRLALLSMIIANTFGLVVMLPYFAYVFRFLEPTAIIARIRREATASLSAGATAKTAARVAAAQRPAVVALEELTDITSNSISGKDKIIASRAVDAIKDFVLDYQAIKGRAHATWFQISPRVRDNPDFVAMDPESLGDLEQRKTWLEWKALRQYLGIYAEAQGAMPDINYLIAIDTRYIGEEAARRGDARLLELVFRFMNSYLRAALNAKAVRTAYNVLNQYRLLIEALLRGGQRDAAVEGVRHMLYYGRTAFDMSLGFVTETVAYDIGTLCELDHALSGGKADDALLELLLDLDQPLRLRKQEHHLQGVRQAQVKLACYYLTAGEEARARRIAADMKDEDTERLGTIREQLAAVESKDFWEIIDRGRNFEYMPPAQKAQMEKFFAWLSSETPAGSR